MRERDTPEDEKCNGVLTVIEGEKARNYIVFDELNMVDEVEGAEVFAEERVAHAHIVHKERRQQENHHQQAGILETCQRLQLLRGELLRGNFMEQFLKPAEGTQKTADKASQQDSQQNEKACDIIGKAELGRPHYRLKRPDRTSTGGCRAGVAIQPGYTYGFPCALIQFALEKVRQMQVGQ